MTKLTIRQKYAILEAIEEWGKDWQNETIKRWKNKEYPYPEWMEQIGTARELRKLKKIISENELREIEVYKIHIKR